MKEIAVYGGTFDPPTRAHEAIMRACLAVDGIDELWIMPSGYRQDKPGMSPNESRLGLLQSLLDDEFDEFPVRLSTFEMNLPQPTETQRTTTALAEAYPMHQFWYVFGADSIATMNTWGGGELLRQTLHILAVPRSGYDLPAETDRIRHLPIGEVALAGISSSAVRSALCAGDPVEHLVSPVVARQLRRM
jgi:nicotinate-nucleotide adenylyltransferase